MKSRRVILLIVSIGLMILISRRLFPQSKSQSSMKLNAGIVTSKLKESKEFYQTVLGFKVVFENDFYLLMSTQSGNDQLSFLLPNHESQQSLFQSAFTGKGVYLTIEVNNADSEYSRIKKLSIPIAIDLRSEPWGDRHFAIVDPNGIGIDIVTYSPPAK
jgi:catechol 2,3-dioxygenase-like lactoylglutathione lyase family enzyme